MGMGLVIFLILVFGLFIVIVSNLSPKVADKIVNTVENAKKQPYQPNVRVDPLSDPSYSFLSCNIFHYEPPKFPEIYDPYKNNKR